MKANLAFMSVILFTGSLVMLFQEQQVIAGSMTALGITLLIIASRLKP